MQQQIQASCAHGNAVKTKHLMTILNGNLHHTLQNMLKKVTIFFAPAIQCTRKHCLLARSRTKQKPFCVAVKSPFVLRSTAKELHLFAAKVLLHTSNISTMISSTRHIKGAFSFATMQIADPSFAHPEMQSSSQRLMRVASTRRTNYRFPEIHHPQR